MSRVLGRDKELIRFVHKDSIILLPDSVFEDTTLEYTMGDTISIMPDGLDTMFVLYEDTIIGTGDSLSEELRTYDITKDIKINIGGTTNTINNGLFGIAIEGIFANGKIPEGDTYNPNAWNWISDLCPKSIRFPGGAGSRWVHLLPYDKDGDDIDDPIKGYGIDIYEIIRFYDITDGVIDAADPEFVEYIMDDLILNNGECISYTNWMKFETDGSPPESYLIYKEQFEELYQKWIEQQELDEEDPNIMYIDQFVHLIKKIQDENPGHIVDVILDLNIMSESAAQNKKIVQYLRDGSEDGNNYGVDINVVGVEMGNEMYFDWAVLMMGFNSFNNYWNYINGANPHSGWTTAFYDYIFQGDIATDHDYIQTFKGDPLFECKVGLPADNLPYDSPYAFKSGDITRTSNWNASLAHSSIYNATITSGHEIRYKFDAIILHPYYESDQNWEHIMLDNLWDKYPETLGVWHPCADATTEEWQFASTDIRLRDAFWKLLGTSAFSPSGCFRNLIKQDYIDSYDEQNARFKFYLTTDNRKELWTTEWNLKDKNGSLNSIDQAIVSSGNNSFAHGLLIQEWWLKNLKLNFDASYKENFFTYANFHGFAGGATNALLVNADKGDFLNHIPPLDPDYYGSNEHWLRRTTYYVMNMISEISKNELNYLPSNSFIYLNNPNISPTVFIDPDHSCLYIYYSNMKDVTQSYIVNPHHLIDIYPEAMAVGFEDATLYYIEADQPYSSSGKSDIFKINTCYTLTNLHPFEIQSITGPIENIPEVTDGIPGGALCVSVPRLTTGYIKIPIQVVELKTDAYEIEQLIKIYPNPSGDYFKVGSDMSGLLIGELEINIYSLSGSKTVQIKANENEQINISNLPNGIYFVKIQSENNITVTKINKNELNMKTNKFILADYAKMAAILLLYNTKANTQVVYTDMDPDIELLFDHETAGIDIDNNGMVDFVFLRTSGSYYTWYSGTELRFRQADWVLPYESVNGILGSPETPSNSLNNLVPPLDSSFLISSKRYFQNTSYQFMSFGFYKESGNWFYAFGFPVWNTLDGVNRYIGVKFIDSIDCFHYGWIRCEIEDSCKRLIIKDYAFELECDAPIAAGSKESYVGVINSTTIDASVYSFSNSVYIHISVWLINAELRVYNLEGKEIYKSDLQNPFTEIKLDTPKGLYLVEIITEGGKFTKKVYLG